MQAVGLRPRSTPPPSAVAAEFRRSLHAWIHTRASKSARPPNGGDTAKIAVRLAQPCRAVPYFLEQLADLTERKLINLRNNMASRLFFAVVHVDGTRTSLTPGHARSLTKIITTILGSRQVASCSGGLRQPPEQVMASGG
jgi:hypothetical protein